MNYQETLAYLDSLGKFGIRLGMERIEGLLRELGNLERKIKTIHVTGTNGKGFCQQYDSEYFACC